MILEYLKRNEKNMIFSTIITIILGIVLLIKPEDSMRFITISLALVFLVGGVLELFSYIRKSQEERLTSFSLIIGIVLLCAGIYLFVRNESLAKFITVVIGFSIGLKALFRVQYSINMKSVSTEWINNLLVALIELVLAIVLVVNPFESAALFLRIIGLILLVGGVFEVLQSVSIIRQLDQLHNAITDGVTIEEVSEVEEVKEEVKAEKVEDKPKKKRATKKTTKKKAE